jgi:hypothetical protein
MATTADQDALLYLFDEFLDRFWSCLVVERFSIFRSWIYMMKVEGDVTLVVPAFDAFSSKSNDELLLSSDSPIFDVLRVVFHD